MFLRPRGTAPTDLHIETANIRIRFNNASRRLDLFRSKSRGTVAESRSVNSDTLLYRAELSILLYCSPFPRESTARHELSINCKYHHRAFSVIERQSRTDCRLLSYRRFPVAFA